MSETKIESNYKTYSVLDLIQEEVDKIKNKIPEDFDSIAKFLEISHPVVEVILMNCGDWTDQCEHMGRGAKPVSHASLMLIHILAKMLNVCYRQVERELNAHPTWLKALKLTKAPSHSRLSTFRTEMGESFFKDFFYNLTDLLHRLNLIKGDSVIIDSAPILASMNFARVNIKPKINIERVRDFFTSIDVSPAINALKITWKSKYNSEPFIRFFMFEKLGGFLSRAQTLKFLKENPQVAEILGFKKDVIPVQATFTNFTNRHGPIPELLTPMVDGVTQFFEDCNDTPEDSDIDFFFWSF